MSFLDIILILLGLGAGVVSYMTGKDSLYKLFLGLLIGFLAYLLVAEQVKYAGTLSPAVMNGYQRFITENATKVLSFMLLLVPFLGLFFMFNPRLHFDARHKSLSHLLLGLLLPFFLIGILAYLSQDSILSGSPFWQKIFSFFAGSGIFQLFLHYPWIIFFILLFLIFYKSVFALLWAFGCWLWDDIISGFFTSWDTDKKSSDTDEYDDD